ncbi:MAG: hypothetical protein IJE00_01275 [Clostridia bacterium]|nr:hypothetical protein [Clostridia bacterium]
MNEFLFRPIDLQLFADGGDGGAATGEGGETGVTASDAEVQETGVTASDAEVQKEEQQQPIDRKAAFKALVSKGGEYAEEYHQAVREILDGRLRDANEMATKYAAFEPVLASIAKQYGVDPNDTAALLAAVNGDMKTLEQRALENDTSPEHERKMMALEQELAKTRARERARGIQEEYNALLEQEKLAKAAYPDFDYATECKDGTFARLISSGVPMKTAYEVVHHEALVTGAIAHAVQDTERKVVDRIAANGRRPQENGMSAGVPTQSKRDVASISPEERDRINARVKGGERGIDFVTKY